MKRRNVLARLFAAAPLAAIAHLAGRPSAQAATPSPAEAEPDMWYRVLGVKVSNMERSLAFYTDVVGLKLVLRTDTKAKKVATLNVTGDLFTIEPLLVLEEDLDRKEPLNIGNGFIWIGYRVKDAPERLERVKAMGYAVRPEILDNARISSVAGYFHDPDGYQVELATVKKK